MVRARRQGGGGGRFSPTLPTPPLLPGILKRLAEAEGDITEDRELIESLENTKRIATDIAEKSAIAQRTTIEINITSEKYRPVAHRCVVVREGGG